MNPRTGQYLDAAARNQTIARRMLERFDSGVTPPHDDWVITIAFYSALHLVDAYLAEEMNRTPESHRERNQVLRGHPLLSSISPEYNSLRSASERVRYQPEKRVPADAVQQAFDQLEVIRHSVLQELSNA